MNGMLKILLGVFGVHVSVSYQILAGGDDLILSCGVTNSSSRLRPTHAYQLIVLLSLFAIIIYSSS